MIKLTKIVCTIGPASDSQEHLNRFVEYGMDVARLNFSHGNYDYFSKVIKRIRKASKTVAIMLDTKGPEVRTAELNKPMFLEKGERVLVTKSKGSSFGKVIEITYDMSNVVKKGDIMLIGDGIVQLKVVAKKGKKIICKSLSKSTLGSRKSLVVPGKDLGIPSITKKDIEDIKFGIKQGVDLIALSLVQDASSVKWVKQMVAKNKIGVIAKIEHPFAVDNIDKIIAASDGIMVARGDLGLNMALEKVPLIQKRIIKKSNISGKPVIVATQMLESMTTNPTPTRAEVSDVANAILDGADAVMLSKETAAGKFPHHAVKEMVRIINSVDRKVEPNLKTLKEAKNIPEAIAFSVMNAAKSLHVEAIITPTQTGFTPLLISKFRPNIPIFALVNSEEIERKLRIVRGVKSFTFVKKNYQVVRDAVKAIVKQKHLSPNDIVIVTFNHVSTENLITTNSMEIKIVADILKIKRKHSKKMYSIE